MRTDTYRHQGLREAMCKALQQKGISDQRVLSAMRRVPRHWFLDMALDNLAYEDRALSIGCDQTISRPSTVAMQSQLLSVEPGMKVLEIGTGSGYQTSVLCEMGAKVYTIERQQELFARTKKLIYELRYNAKCYLGDGYSGLTEIELRPTARIQAEGKEKINYNFFDRVIITCGAPCPFTHALKSYVPPASTLFTFCEMRKYKLFMSDWRRRRTMPTFFSCMTSNVPPTLAGVSLNHPEGIPS